MSEFRGDSSRSLSDSTPPQSIRRRKRHDDWERAQKFVNQFCFSAEDRRKCLEGIIKCAYDYKKDISEKAIVLQHKEKEELLVLPYNTRFSDSYLDNLLDKLDRIKWKFMRLGGRHSMLTVTLDPNRYLTLGSYRIARKQISELLRRIKRKFKPRAYLCVSELHHGEKAYGQVHFHILLVGVMFIPLDWLKEQIKALELGNENIKEVRGSGADAVSYFTKYVRKSLKELDKDSGKSLYELFHEENGSNSENDKIPELLALLWALDMRFFSYSRSCLESDPRGITRLILHQWIYVGVYPAVLFHPIPTKIIDPDECWRILQSKPPP